MDLVTLWTMLKLPLTVLVTDTLLWFKWAVNDGTISSYEWKILLNRLITFGTAGVLLVALGVSWDVASASAGLGIVGEAWIKTLIPDKTITPASTEPITKM